MSIIRDEKQRLRERCRILRDGLAPDDRIERDKKICELFMSLAVYRFSDTVLIYSPIKSEINVWCIFNAAAAAGKHLALPLCSTSSASEMSFRLVSSKNDLHAGKFGTLEPLESCSFFHPETDSQHAICILPGLAFDNEGYRLGYGKGYYDRYLPMFRGSKVGLVYSDLILDRVPRGRYDLKVDLLVSEKGVILTNAS